MLTGHWSGSDMTDAERKFVELLQTREIRQQPPAGLRILLSSPRDLEIRKTTERLAPQPVPALSQSTSYALNVLCKAISDLDLQDSVREC